MYPDQIKLKHILSAYLVFSIQLTDRLACCANIEAFKVLHKVWSGRKHVQSIMILIGKHQLDWTIERFRDVETLSDDNSCLFNKKSLLQTKYRPLFLKKTEQKYRPLLLKIQTKIWNAIAQSKKLSEGITIVQGVYFDIITVESNSIYQTFLNLHKRM